MMASMQRFCSVAAVFILVSTPVSSAFSCQCSAFMPAAGGARPRPLGCAMRIRGQAKSRQKSTKIMAAGQNPDQSYQDIINDRMASEFERVSAELRAMGELPDDDLICTSELGKPRSDLADGGQSSFSPQELETLQAILEPGGGGVSEGVTTKLAAATFSCGGEAYSSIGHTAVVTGDGRLFIWGSGGGGRLGRDSCADEVLPVEVKGKLEEVRKQGVRVRAVSCGFDHSACVTEDGRVFAWGGGSRGQVTVHPLTWILPMHLCARACDACDRAYD
jgi:hypothetical protein